MSATPSFHPKRILMIKLGAMGDLVMCSALFEAVRQAFPDAQTALLTGKTYVSLMQNNPSLDEVIPADDKKLYRGKRFDQLGEMLRLARLMRKRKFDLVFVLHRAWQFNLLAWMSGAPRRVGYARGREGIGLTDRVTLPPRRNEREGYLDLLRVLGVPTEYQRSYFYLSAQEDQFLPEFIERHEIPDATRVVGLGPGGGKNVKSFMPTRRWPIANFTRLARLIGERAGHRVIVFGGPDERELAEAIGKECPGCIDATQLSFGEMASVFRRCQVFVGNDSGPLHIADGMQVPVIGLYGPTDPKVQAPMGPNVELFFKDIECSPCYDNGDFPDCDHINCLQSITVEEVWERVQQCIP